MYKLLNVSFLEQEYVSKFFPYSTDEMKKQYIYIYISSESYVALVTNGTL